MVAGRELIGSAGFEFAKEGAERVLLVTDQVIRGTGLVEKVEAGSPMAGSRSSASSTTSRRTPTPRW